MGDTPWSEQPVTATFAIRKRKEIEVVTYSILSPWQRTLRNRSLFVTSVSDQ